MCLCAKLADCLVCLPVTSFQESACSPGIWTEELSQATTQSENTIFELAFAAQQLQSKGSNAKWNLMLLPSAACFLLPCS